jgi:hypothetical protein
MQRAAHALQPLALADWGMSLPPVRFLTGARFFHQTAFCARSLTRACDTELRFEFFDDGSLRPADIALLTGLFPSARIVPEEDCVMRLNRHLPESDYPTLRTMRAFSPLTRKLLDLRAGLSGPSLYLDSDMLFFAPPRELIEWLRSPTGAIYMREPGEGGAYVDALPVLEEQLGDRIAPGVNTGIVALDDARIDWKTLERWAAQLSEAQRRHMWAEQTLMARQLTSLNARALSCDDYQVCTSRRDLTRTRPVMRHYVHKAKMPYVAGEWRHCE